MKFYAKMTEIIDNKKIFEKAESGYDALGQMKSKYHGLFCKIDDYFKYKYEIVVDVKKAEKSLSVQPVFMGSTSDIFCQQNNLFMSATMNYAFMVTTMKLNPDECELIKVDYVFNKDDKIIDMTRAKRKINYANMHSDEVVKEFCNDLESIYKIHADQSGVVIATSFKMAELLSQAKSSTHDIILHTNNEPAREIIRRFKQTNRPTVLISPSLFEGVDLPGLESQFQIMPKAPYLSLGSKRMFYISRKHRGVYLQMSIMRMIQGCGRSTRFVGDKAITYMLDLNCGTLLRSKHNTWREQFTLLK
jgi:Rad3-related DNA helicase